MLLYEEGNKPGDRQQNWKRYLGQAALLVLMFKKEGLIRLLEA